MGWRMRLLRICLIVLTLLTTQSTTAYLGMLGLVGCMILSRRKDKLRTWIILLGVLGMTALLTDYGIREENSLLNEVIFRKVKDILHDTANDIYGVVASGQARLITILMCIRSIREHPLGIGIDKYNLVLRQSTLYGDQAVAAVLFSAAAQIGVIPVLITVRMYIHNLLRRAPEIPAVLAATLLFFNTLLAQCDLFYPVLWLLMYIPCRKRRSAG